MKIRDVVTTTEIETANPHNRVFKVSLEISHNFIVSKESYLLVEEKVIFDDMKEVSISVIEKELYGDILNSVHELERMIYAIPDLSTIHAAKKLLDNIKSHAQ